MRKSKKLKLWMYRHEKDNDFHFATQYPFWAVYCPYGKPEKYWSDFKPVEVEIKTL